MKNEEIKLKLNDLKKIKIEPDETLLIKIPNTTNLDMDYVQEILNCKILIVDDFDRFAVIKTIKK